MKTLIHRAKTRGFFDHGWLKTHHSFSFARYYNPDRMNFGLLRVLNDDIIDPGMGFGSHPHQNMEIVTIPISGALEHKDSTGHKEIIHPNDVQIMSAGSGVTHSEYNGSSEQQVKLLQIWVLPDKKNIEPRYDQKTFDHSGGHNQWQTLVSPETGNGALWINQQACFSRTKLDEGKSLGYSSQFPGNGYYIFIIAGNVKVADLVLGPADGLGVWDTSQLKLEAKSDARILLIDVPMDTQDTGRVREWG